MIDAAFYVTCFLYAGAIGLVLFLYRREPLYDPRVLFSLAASLWLLIIHGYIVDFEGYLAAKPELYSHDIKTLSTLAIGMMLIGYVAFICGASLGSRIRGRQVYPEFSNYRLLTAASLCFVALSLLNFAANVILIADGNVVRYLAAVSERTYQIADDQGVSAVGYVLGVVGIQLLAYNLGRLGGSRFLKLGFVVLLLSVLVMRFSQARVFQTLVLLGACYVSYSMGIAHRSGKSVPWFRQVHYLVLVGLLGISLYFLRLVSRLEEMGVSVSYETISRFMSHIVHFAFERGNVPNFPIVFTIIDQMPSEVDFLYGKTLFNWVIYLVPKSILPPDYLISIWIKNTWYLDIQGGGLPPTAVGEWYANFGLGGVVLGMLAVGLCLGFIYRTARDSKSPYMTALWANLVFGFVVIYPKTDLAQIPVFSLLVVLCLWFVVQLLQSAAGRRYA